MAPLGVKQAWLRGGKRKLLLSPRSLPQQQERRAQHATSARGCTSTHVEVTGARVTRTAVVNALALFIRKIVHLTRPNLSPQLLAVQLNKLGLHAMHGHRGSAGREPSRRIFKATLETLASINGLGVRSGARLCVAGALQSRRKLASIIGLVVRSGARLCVAGALQSR